MPKTSDSFETFYEFKEINEKNTIVFIHGVGLNNEIWEPQTNYFRNYNVLTYDLLGHGKTPLKKNKLSFEDYSKQLLKLVNELNLDKIHLVGFSLGALIARNFASEHGDRLNSLILHGSIYERSKDQQKIVWNRFNVSKMNREASKQGAIRRWFNEGFIKKNQNIYNKIYSCLKNNNLKNFLKSYELFVNFKDNDDIIRKINTNTLITTGENDIGSTPEMAQNLSKKINNSKFQIIKSGRHLCSIECAEVFNITIKEFIDNNA
jgi:pimeloyl-ACP methyl ester carboxylesterase